MSRLRSQPLQRSENRYDPRQSQPRHVALTTIRKTPQALHEVPPVVEAGRICLDHVDFLALVLADVGDVQLPPVEGIAERIAQTDRPAFVPGRAGKDWVIRRNSVGKRADVQAQQLTEERGRVLAVARRITAATAVPNRKIKHAVGTECHSAAVVIVVCRVGNPDHQLRARGVEQVRVAGRNAVTLDDDIALVTGNAFDEMDEYEGLAARELRMKGK